MKIEISELKRNEISSYANLIKEVYDEFVAHDYSEEGNKTFYNFIARESILQRMQNGNLMIYARIDGKMIGAYEIRDRNHISLFFVKKQYHRQGIGKELFKYSLHLIQQKYPEISKVTVHSSPYAFPIYKRFGFIETSSMQEKNGIKYFPMAYEM